MTSIAEDRKKSYYRFLEGLIGYVSFGFLGLMVILAYVSPPVVAVFLIVYSFLQVIKTSLLGVYTIYSYKNLRRWEQTDWISLISTIDNNPNEAKKQLIGLKNKFKSSLDWGHKLNEDIVQLDQIQGTPFARPSDIFHVAVFAVYNESPDILIRSLRSIFDSKYDLSKILVTISQEARAGEAFNQESFAAISEVDWIQAKNFSEKDLDIVYNSNFEALEYTKEELRDWPLSDSKLNVIFTQHPDGLVGEIKGKASNEDWGARQASLIIKSKQIDEQTVVVTSLDSDSRIGPHFFHMLSYRYCLTPDRLQAGFQPIPVYSNNFFTANLFPRLVATNTTIWHMIQYTLLDELHFFANYCVPLKVLHRVNFWVREVIAEDSMIFAKCFVTYKGNFRVVPFYGTFEGDAVDGDDYFENIASQYKQLQRWAWGGIEGFPYKFKRFFIDKEGGEIDLRKRVKFVLIEFMNHFFWSTSPVVFSILTILPQVVGGAEFQKTPISLNLWVFSQYFAWLSFIFLIISSYITFRYIAYRSLKNIQARWYHWIIVSLQWIISPFIFILWGPPALDVQFRGIMGWYLGYWVTPKK